MNHFRTRQHHDYQIKAPPGAVAEGETMAEFAANTRKIREQKYHGSQVRARAKRKGQK